MRVARIAIAIARVIRFVRYMRRVRDAWHRNMRAVRVLGRSFDNEVLTLHMGRNASRTTRR